MLVSATVMAKCVPENVEVVCPHEILTCMSPVQLFVYVSETQLDI